MNSHLSTPQLTSLMIVLSRSLAQGNFLLRAELWISLLITWRLSSSSSAWVRGTYSHNRRRSQHTLNSRYVLSDHALRKRRVHPSPVSPFPTTLRISMGTSPYLKAQEGRYSAEGYIRLRSRWWQNIYRPEASLRSTWTGKGALHLIRLHHLIARLKAHRLAGVLTSSIVAKIPFWT